MLHQLVNQEEHRLQPDNLGEHRLQPDLHLHLRDNQVGLQLQLVNLEEHRQHDLHLHLQDNLDHRLQHVNHLHRIILVPLVLPIHIVEVANEVAEDIVVAVIVVEAEAAEDIAAAVAVVVAEEEEDKLKTSSKKRLFR